jgi:putative tryptophan/tyrosine transport system substrate-binding protein
VMPFLEQLQKASAAVHLQDDLILVRDGDELEGAFSAMKRGGADAVVIQGSLPVQAVVDLALRYRLPSLSTQKSAVQNGILMSYSANFAERARVLADYVDKLFKGANPAHLPVQQPTRYELTINMKTARALGIDVPPMLLARADEVIE